MTRNGGRHRRARNEPGQDHDTPAGQHTPPVGRQDHPAHRAAPAGYSRHRNRPGHPRARVGVGATGRVLTRPKHPPTSAGIRVAGRGRLGCRPVVTGKGPPAGRAGRLSPARRSVNKCRWGDTSPTPSDGSWGERLWQSWCQHRQSVAVRRIRRRDTSLVGQNAPRPVHRRTFRFAAIGGRRGSSLRDHAFGVGQANRVGLHHVWGAPESAGERLRAVKRCSPR